jgi:hypothetical protein
MNVGMLWYDSGSGNDVSARIMRASEYYRDKYGREPNLCYLNPVTSENELPTEVGGLKIETSSMVLPDHFWIGVDKAENGKAAHKRAA